MRIIEADPRLLVAVCVMASVGCLLLFVRRGIASYRMAFVATVSTGLKQNFIVADARSLFLIEVVLTAVLGSSAYVVLGPAGAVAGALVAIVAPRFAVTALSRRRTRQFVYQLPDALLALASALRAGSNLIKGIELLAHRHLPPLSQEFTVVLAEYRIGRPLEDSLADMRRRVATDEVDLMNTAINVSRRVGGNLAETLEALARTLQEKAHMEGKIDALTSMGRAQGWVIGLLPIFIGVVLYQQQPERMSLMFTEWYGWVVLSVIAVMMTLAAWMIRRIVSIDV